MLPQIDAAGVRTAGVILRYQDRFVFQAGFNRDGDALGVVRLGGHVEDGESPEECARREVVEEAGVEALLLPAQSTFHYDSDLAQLDPRAVEWQLPGLAPVLVATSHASPATCSVTYLAECLEPPWPSSETQALVMLSAEEVGRMTREVLTLGDFLRAGGLALFAVDLPDAMPLRPFAQLSAVAVLLEDRSL